MSGNFTAAFSALKSVFAGHLLQLVVKSDTAAEYNVYTKVPSPFPQHKGHRIWFGSVRLGKAYASFHLMPLYMNDELTAKISPALKKRMQGKTCFNFKNAPEPELLEELGQLTDAGVKHWSEKGWL
jgi:hypothetical protein